ncbi:MAG: nucleotidyltransferase [Spirochaetaceae bacterium]|nr:nucleotidyltransferase [Spirochaetaceae bacterium]
MNTQPDFEELLKLLEENNVDYMVIGGYAVAFYGYPRFTKDIDILYNLEEDNINRIKKSLSAFGFSEVDLPYDLFSEKGNIIKFGIEPVRIDLLNEIDGVEFSKIADDRVRGRYGKVEISFIGRKDLISNKRASGRIQDLADIEKLESS